MTFFLKVVAVALLVVAGCYWYINRDRKNAGRRIVEVLIVCIIMSVVVFILSCSFTIIPTGYTGVRSMFGQIDTNTLDSGIHWKAPFVQSIKTVNNKQQDIEFEDRVWSETSERTAIYYENITVTYQINSEKSAWIYTNITDYKHTLVSQSLVASSIKSSSKTLTDVDATNRAIIESLVTSNLQKSLDDKCGENVVHINKVIISNADFDESYNQAIAARQQAQIEAEKQAIENQKAIDKAEADAIVKKTKAEADAEAVVIAAKAEVEANELLENSLTERILRQRWIEKWNGQLPQFVSGENEELLYGIEITEIGASE